MMCRFNERSQSFSVPVGRGHKFIGMLSHRGSIWEKTILVDDMITQREMALAQGCQIKIINLSQAIEEKSQMKFIV